MVDRPMIFTLDELKRFPATSRICFLECSGNYPTGAGSRDEAGERRRHDCDDRVDRRHARDALPRGGSEPRRHLVSSPRGRMPR